MAKLNIRNRNAGKLTKEGKPKPPNWEYRFEAGKVDGKRKQISKAGFKTKKEAELEGNKALNEYNNSGLAFEPSEISVADYFEYWINNYCKLNTADSTLSTYRNIIKNHILPRIGKYKLKAVSTMVLQEMINDLYIRRGFTREFYANILKVIKGAFSYAKVTAKLIQVNPAADVSLPKPQVDEDAEEDDIIVLSKSDISRILERFKDSTASYYAILTAYYTGMRVGEVFGLTWDCIDFEKKQITVNKIVKKIEINGKTSDAQGKRGIRGKSQTRWYLGACKTPSSYRTISIGDTLVNALKEYKQWQEANKEDYGEFYTRHYLQEEITETNRKVKRIIPIQDTNVELPLEKVELAFVKENGEYRGTDTVRYPSKIINYELGIQFNFHALRHTHATMLIEGGAPIKSVSKRLGHSTVKTTMELYVHETEKMIEDTVNTFEAVGQLNDDGKIIDFNEIKRKADTIAN